nr:hypothetical protein [Tanacetum cinerariifolium]
RNNSFSQQGAPTFDQLFEINDLKAQPQEKDTVIVKLKERLKSLSGNVKDEKIKRELEEIETINIELDHRVTKLVAENEHLKQTYKQLYDSIKSSREKVLVITALKETLSKLKGKAVVTEAVTLHPIDPELLKIDVALLALKLCNNNTAHTDYLRHTQEETATLREIRNNSFSQQSAPTFDQLFEINDLKAQSQKKDTVIVELKERLKSLSGTGKKEKIKMELEEIETINIELDHRVTKLVAENKHLKQTYKQLLQEKVLVITALKETLSKLKGKDVVSKAVTLHPIDPELLKIDVAPLAPKFRNNRTAHTDYLKHTQEETATLREIVKRTKLVAVTPKNNDKKIRLTEQIPLSGNTPAKTTSSTNIISNTHVLSSIGVNLLSGASGSQPQGNTKNDRIQRAPRKAKKNKLEDHHRTVSPSLNKKNSVVDTKAISSVTNSKLNVNADLKCATCNGCLFSDNHDACVLAYINSVNARAKSKSVKKPVNRKFWQPTGKMFTTIGHIWRPTGQTFTLVGNVCPLTRITTTAIVPLREPIPIKGNTDKPVVTLVYSRKSKAAKKKVPVSCPNCSLVFGLRMLKADRSQLINFIQKFLGTVKFRNDHVAKIMGYGDYKIGNVMISRVYFVEGLGHNLFSVGKFCDSDLEVAFRQYTCFIRNLDGVDMLTGSRGNNLYTLSLQDMMASSPIFRPSLNKKKSVVDTKAISSAMNSKLNVNADLKCATCNGCLFFDNHDSCVLAYINSVNASLKSKSVPKPVNRKIWQPTGKMFTTVGHIWRPTRRTFTLVENVCPLTRIATSAIVPLREPIPIESNIDKPVLTLIYSRKSKAAKKKVPVSNLKINKSLVANKTEPKNSWVSTSSNVPSSLIECRFKFGNAHVAKITGFGDYKIGNVTISRVYFVEGLGHNLFSVRQFCDSDLEVAFLQHTFFIRNLDGVDLLTGSKTKSWLWHRRLSHLNFGAINHLARQGLVRGLPKLKFEKDHLCSACAMGKKSVNGKKYILVIVDDYSRFTWVKILKSKDEASDFIIKFLKMIQVRLKVPVHRIQTDNGTEFVNQTLREYYEEVGISHETSIARSP